MKTSEVTCAPPRGTDLRLRVGCEFRVGCEVPTPAVVMVRPSDERALARETWRVDPEAPSRETCDAAGNRIVRLVIGAGDSLLRYDAVVTVPTTPDDSDLGAAQLPPEALPDETLTYLVPSRYCPSDLLADKAWAIFGDRPPGWGRVQAISDWTHDNICFRLGASGPTTSAAETFEHRAGVCRDFAHLAITFCRALNVPARYAFGYLPDIGVPPSDVPMDFCAWTEVFLAGRWWTFDPRNNQRRIAHVVVGRGRDAADVPMLLTFGPATLQKLTVWADQIT